MISQIASEIKLKAWVDKAVASGMPKDQTKRFMEFNYYPLPSMMEFHKLARECDIQGGPLEIGIGGTRGPGKSHAIMAQVALDDCQRYPGLKWLFLRKVQLSAAESLEDLIGRVLRYCSHDYKASQGRIDFPNGSRILLGGFNSERDIDKYLGIEYDGLTIEEATQLTDKKVNQIYGSIRSSRSDYITRKYLSTNPDGVGLGWFKRRFVIPWRQGKEKRTRFLHRSYKDNPFIQQDYIDYLDSLEGQLRRAWREGDWDAFEGQAFPVWRHEIHVVEPFEIPEHWLKWRAVDEGYAAPWCCLWFAMDPYTQRIYVYREAYATKLTAQQQALRIVTMTMESEEIYATFADPAMWGQKNVDNQIKTSAQEYADLGVVLTKANNDRLQGKRRVDSALALREDGLPGLQIFRSCVNLIRTLPELVFDEVHVEDVNTKQEDHAYDTLRYGLSNARTATDKEEEEKKKAEQNQVIEKLWSFM